MTGVKAMKWVLVVVVLAAAAAVVSGEDKCLAFETVKEALRAYELPGGLFPDNVESFRCVPVLGNNAYSIALRLRSGGCRVAKGPGRVKVTLEYKRHVSGVISNGEITGLKGVSLEFNIPPIRPPYNFTTTLSVLRVFQISDVKIIQFASLEGVYSQPFPFSMFLSEPPQCDSTTIPRLPPPPRLISLFQ